MFRTTFISLHKMVELSWVIITLDGLMIDWDDGLTHGIGHEADVNTRNTSSLVERSLIGDGRETETDQISGESPSSGPEFIQRRCRVRCFHVFRPFDYDLVQDWCRWYSQIVGTFLSRWYRHVKKSLEMVEPILSDGLSVSNFSQKRRTTAMSTLR